MMMMTMVRRMSTATEQMIAQHRLEFSLSSNAARNSLAFTVFDFLVFSVFILKFFICGTLIALYSECVSKNSGSSTLQAIMSRPSLKSSLLSLELEIELVSESDPELEESNFD